MPESLYRFLVDLYAGDELSEELRSVMEIEALRDPELLRDMNSLRTTVALLQSLPDPAFTEESCQRIRMRIYARGGAAEIKSPPPAHLQYRLPMSS
jgi:hypothetical protein